ncbi:MAG: hypothetical protein GXO48_00325 [Chlorobi bacterium]|nr:hypothetical protein [Chlorobiota bacterium]
MNHGYRLRRIKDVLMVGLAFAFMVYPFYLLVLGAYDKYENIPIWVIYFIKAVCNIPVFGGYANACPITGFLNLLIWGALIGLAVFYKVLK